MDFQWPMRVVSASVDTYVLSVLALADGHSFTTGQLARMTPASEEGLRKVLKRLDRNGIVVSERVGPAVGYRFNSDHLAAEPISQLARLAAAFRDRLENAMDAWELPPTYAAVFGSVGRGEASESSDVDLLVVRPEIDARRDEVRWQTQLTDLTVAVRAWTGNTLEIVELAESELHVPSILLADIRDQGLTVYGRPSWFRQTLREWDRADP